jgi:DNA-binding response OmpR family regulator
MVTELKKILIMEDEKPMARALELKLNHSGFLAISVNDGQAGLDLLAKEKFSLILLDLMMPKLDGFSVLQSLQANNNQVPVVVVSNLSQEEDEAKVKALGAKAFFIKSNTPITTLVNYIQGILK